MNAYSKRVQTSEGKSDIIDRPAQPPIKCPECDSSQIWKDGIRYTKTGQIQRGKIKLTLNNSLIELIGLSQPPVLLNN